MGCFLSKPHQAYLGMKSSVSIFHNPDALERKMWLVDRIGCKTQVWQNVSHHDFCGIRTGPTKAWKIVHQDFMPWMHLNIVRDPQITPVTNTQARCNVLRRASCWTHTRPTWKRKVVHQRFVLRTHQNAHCVSQIAPVTKTQVWHNVSWAILVKTTPGLLGNEK
jgi:hypothetical protein